MCGERVHRLRRHPDRALRVALDEAPHQHGDVGRALSQGRHLDAHHRDAIEEVLPKAPLVHPRLERSMGRGDQPDIDGLGDGAADRSDLAFLEHP